APPTCAECALAGRGHGEPAAQAGRPVPEPAELEEPIPPRIETPPDVYGEEAGGGELRPQRPNRSPADAKGGTPELSKDEQVVQDDIDDDHDDRRRDESP